MSSLLKNSDGKILKNSGGSVLKQNYNLGNKFIPLTTSSSGIFIRFHDIPLVTPYSIDIIEKTAIGGNGPGVLRIIDDSGRIGYLRVWNTHNPDYIRGTSRLLEQQVPLPEYLIHLQMGVDMVDTDIYKSARNPNYTIENRNSEINPSGIIDIDVNGVGPGGARGGYSIGEIRIYTRHQTEVERNYNANKGLYNEPLSTSGLLIRCRMNVAEILDFSALQDGSDMRPGVKDISGNNLHGELLNLPAGTNQEKVDYANENVFVKW